jgi:hypothetical protein
MESVGQGIGGDNITIRITGAVIAHSTVKFKTNYAPLNLHQW